MKNNRGSAFSKVLVIMLLLFVLAFILVNLYIFWQRGVEPTTLILSTFGLVAGEFGLLAWIKKTKIRQGGAESEYYTGGAHIQEHAEEPEQYRRYRFASQRRQ
jgi:hypothetical protein